MTPPFWPYPTPADPDMNKLESTLLMCCGCFHTSYSLSGKLIFEKYKQRTIYDISKPAIFKVIKIH